MNKYLVEFLGTLFLVFVIFATGNYLAIGAALAIHLQYRFGEQTKPDLLLGHSQ